MPSQPGELMSQGSVVLVRKLQFHAKAEAVDCLRGLNERGSQTTIRCTTGSALDCRLLLVCADVAGHAGGSCLGNRQESPGVGVHKGALLARLSIFRLMASSCLPTRGGPPAVLENASGGTAPLLWQT